MFNKIYFYLLEIKDNENKLIHSWCIININSCSYSIINNKPVVFRVPTDDKHEHVSTNLASVEKNGDFDTAYSYVASSIADVRNGRLAKAA